MKYICSKYSILLLLISCCCSGPVQAQDPYLQHGNREAREQANRLMQYYQQELGMQVEQAFLFRNKAEEFIIRRQKLKALDMTVKEKLHMLRELSDQETAEMANILTRPQLRAYRKLKPGIQPVEIVVAEGQNGTSPDQ